MNQPSPSTADRAIAYAAVVVWAAVTVALNLLGIALVPFEVGDGVLVPVSLIIIAAANLVLPKVFFRGTAVGWSRFLPAAIWLITTLPAATVSDTGDLLLPGTTHSAVISLLYLGVGAAAAIMGLVFAKTDLRSFRRRTRPDGPE